MKDRLSTLTGPDADGVVHGGFQKLDPATVVAAEFEAFSFLPDTGAPTTYQRVGPVSFRARRHDVEMEWAANPALPCVVGPPATTA